MALPKDFEPNVNIDAVDILPSVFTDDFNFTPSDSWLDTPTTEEFTATIDPQYLAQIDHYKPIIEQYAPSSLANVNSPYPGQSVDQYDPLKQQLPPDFNTADGALQGLDLAMKVKLPQGFLGAPKPQIADPIYSSRKSSQFERYYQHPKFAELGFHPYANNEEYYNQNSTIFNDMSRMMGHFYKQIGSGFLSNYRSTGDLFDSNDNYFTTPDLQTASEFEDAMAIGMSTREGVGSFFNNLLLNSGYTFGIIGSIALEEAILAGITAATRGAAGPLTIPRMMQQGKRLGQTVSNSFKIPRMMKATRQMLQTLNKSDNARNFWRATKTGEWGVIGTLFAPETMAAVKSFKSGKNAAQNLTNLAKTQAFFGGFYRDLRSINLALAESKLEGGMVYNQQLINGMAIEKNKLMPGEEITPDTMSVIKENAQKASFATTMMNFPLIYFSNQFVLGNALGGFNKSFARLMNENISGIGKRLIQTTASRKATGELSKNVIEYAGDGIKGFAKTLKSAGVKGSLRMGLGSSLRYFSNNLAEGLQEIGQEAIAAGTSNYFANLQYNPTRSHVDLMRTAVSSAADSQFSSQGIETFLSGFLMGGIVQGPQKLFFQGIPNLYTRIATPEKYKEYQENKKKFIDSLVKVHNEAWNKMAEDEDSIFDLNVANIAVQKEVADQMKKSAYEDDIFGFIDAKDFGKFQAMYTIFSNGTADIFRSQLKDYLNLTDEELAQAFPTSQAEIKSGKMRERLNGLLNNIDVFEDRFTKNKDKFQNPYDRSKFEKGTTEYKEEFLKEEAYNHAKYLALFTEDGFNRSLERANSIYSELSAEEELMSKIQAKDITVLLDINSIENEIKLLNSEILALEDAPENKELKKQKLKKAAYLFQIQAILTDEANLTKKGNFDLRKISKLEGPFKEYIQFLADSRNDFVNKDKIKETLKKIVDHKTLTGRAKAYDKAIEYLANPERLNEIVERTYDIYKTIFKNNKKLFEERIKQHIEKVEINELLNQLANLDIYPDPMQVEIFLRTGNADVLTKFYNEKGEVNSTTDKKLYDDILSKINIYKESTKKETEKSTKEEIVTKEDELNEVVDQLKLAPDIVLETTDKDIHPTIKALLRKKYNIYKATAENPKSGKEWLNSKESKDIQKLYEVLKTIWYNEKEVSEEDYNKDKGFLDWLKTKQEDDNVLNAFSAVPGISFKDFLNVDENITVSSLSINDKGTQEGNVYKLTSYIVDNGTFYLIERKDGKPLSDEIKTKYNIPQGTTSNKNQAYRIFNELEKSVVTNITNEDLNFNTVNDNTSKLSQFEPIRAFAHINGLFTNNREDRYDAFRRYDIIMENLTPEEIESLELVVSRNNKINDLGFYKTGNKEPNPFIKRASSIYNIGIRIGDENVRNRINNILKAQGFDISDSTDGVFAYIPNNSVVLYDKNGKVITDPRTIDKESAENIFFYNNDNALQNIKNNFAIQLNLINFISNKLGENNKVIIDYKEFNDKFNFKIFSKTSVQKNIKPKSPNDLAYNTVDGTIVILDNRKITIGGTTQRREEWITNEQDVDKQIELTNKIKSDLQSQLLQNEQSLYDFGRSMGAYVAVVKAPNGVYSLVELKAESASEESLNNYFLSILEQAKKTSEENVIKDKNGKSKPKNLAYNNDFNDLNKEDIYITTKPGYTVTLRVDPMGRIRLNIYDIKAKNNLLIYNSQTGTKGAITLKPEDVIKALADINGNKKTPINVLNSLLKELNGRKEVSNKDIKITTESFRQSFVEDATAEDIFNKTTTDIDSRVRYDYRLILSQNSEDVQASLNVALNDLLPAINQNIQESKNKAKTPEQKQQVEDSEVKTTNEDISDSEYKTFIDKGEVSQKTLESIALKAQNQEKLTERELQIFTDKTSEINAILVKTQTQETKTPEQKLEEIGAETAVSPEADIERKRQEELNSLKNIKKGSFVRFTSDGNTFSSEKFKVITYNNKTKEMTLSGGYIPPGGLINIDDIEYFINLYYDAELAALEQQPTSPEADIERKRQEELDSSIEDTDYVEGVGAVPRKQDAISILSNIFSPIFDIFKDFSFEHILMKRLQGTAIPHGSNSNIVGGKKRDKNYQTLAYGEKSSAQTLFHEFLHLVSEAALKVNQTLRKKLNKQAINLLLQTTESDGKTKGLNIVRHLYYDKHNRNNINEEITNFYIDGRIREAIDSLPSDIKEAYLKMIRDTLGGISQEDLNRLTEYADTLKGISATELINKKINAKYDAELAALEQQPIDQKTEQTSTAQQDKSNKTNAKTTQQTSITDAQTIQSLETVDVIDEAIKNRKLEITADLREKKNLKELKTTQKNDKILQDLKAKRDSILGNSKLTNKILPGLTTEDVEDIAVFEEWAQENLPSFISIEDIKTLGNNIKTGGLRVGAFVLGLKDIAGGMNISGTIYTGASNPYRYHEAFHSVFRMLLTDSEISKYLNLARKEVREKLRKEGKSFKQELEKLRNSADTYAKMSEERLKQEYYEEYLADEFEKFKINPRYTKTNSQNKSLFTKIIEWIKSVLGIYKKNEITELFRNIDAAKYRTSKVVSNRFTEDTYQGITLEANALIPIEKIGSEENPGYLYLDPDAANSMIRSMAAIYINREDNYTNRKDDNKDDNNKDLNKTKDELLNDVIKDFKNLYSLDNDYDFDNMSDEKIIKLTEYEQAFEDFSEEIKNAVVKYLNLADIWLEDKLDIADEKEDNEGLRGVDDWDKDASLIGGISSLSAKLRRYLLTTTFESTDIFGNTKLSEDEPLVIPVDFNAVYNGMLKAIEGITEPDKILKSLYIFAQNNEHTNAAVTRLFNDLGITEENILEGKFIESVKNPYFFNSVIKGLENFRVSYIFIHKNTDGRVEVYSAANRDDANTQMDKWGQAFGAIYRNKLSIDNKFKNEALDFINRLSLQLAKNKVIKEITDEKLKEQSKDYSDKFKKYLGISLSPQYIAYNLIQKIENPTLNQSLIKEVNEGAFLIESQMLTILKESLKTSTVGQDYIFSSKKEGMRGHLKKLAIANASFDETVGASVFKNANGDLVYAHQKPTFHLKKMKELNNTELLEELKKQPFFMKNWLLGNDAFIQMAEEGKIGITRISGFKKGSIEASEDGIQEYGTESSNTYGDFTPKEFVTSLLNAYTYLFNSTTGKLDGVIRVEDQTDPKGYKEIATAPVLIKVIEASNTGDLSVLPVVKAVKYDGSSIEITDEVIDGMKNNIKTEFERIKRESNPETRTQRDIEDYNKGKNKATQFVRTGTYLKFEDQKAEKKIVSSTPVKTEFNFQGYKGGFKNKGKGKAEGDGKDKAMREVANGFIGEVSKQGVNNSSTFTSINNVNYRNRNILQLIATDQNNKIFNAFQLSENDSEIKYPVSIQRLSGSNSNPFGAKSNDIIMLARNGVLKNKALADSTKESILNAHNSGAEFVVGDMPGVDTQFIDYLQEIGAKFTIYHTGNKSRINVAKKQINISELFESNSELANQVYEAINIDADQLSYSERVKQYEKLGIKKSDGTPITEDDIRQNPTFYQKNTNQSNDEYVETEKTIRDLAERMANRIGGYSYKTWTLLNSDLKTQKRAQEILKNSTMFFDFINNRSKDFKGVITTEGYPKQTAVINLAYATLDTPIHEILGHPIIRALKIGSEQNKELYQNLLKELEYGKGKEVLDRVKKDYIYKTTSFFSPSQKITYKGKIERITNLKRKYSELQNLSFEEINKLDETKYTLQEQQEEAIVELLGLYTADRLNKVKDGKLISLLKRLLKEIKQFMKSLLKQREVEIDKLPDNMTLGDIADLLAYSDSKLILPGNEVVYTTPDNQTFKTYQEASNHISELVRNMEDVDLNDIKINQKKYITNIDEIKENEFLTQDGFRYIKKDGNWYSSFNLNIPLNNDNVIAAYNSKDLIYDVNEDTGKTFVADGTFNIRDFIEKNKQYEQSKEIIEEWKKVNNIQYDPEEVYSRNQGFYSVVAAYSDFDVNLMFQNILAHIEDNKKAGGEFTISAFTKPIDKRLRHLEGKSGTIRFKIFPKSEDIKWASNIDVFSGSVWDAADKVAENKKSETVGVSYTKAPAIRNLYSIQPNLASIIDDLQHAHNELGIELTGTNFRLEYDNDIPFSTKKLLDAINNILDQKFGKLVEPKIGFKKLDNSRIEKVRNQIDTLDVNRVIGGLTKEEQKEYDALVEEYTELTNGIRGKRPTQTNKNLKESINSIRNRIESNANDYFIEEVVDFDPMEMEEVTVGYKITGVYNKVTDSYNKIYDTEAEANKALNEFKNLLSGKEYTSQALINTKVAALKKGLRKFPRSLIRSEIRPYLITDKKLFEEDEMLFQLLKGDDLTPKERLQNKLTKQQAQQMFTKYVEQTGEQDIEGFKEFVSTQSQAGVEISSNAKGLAAALTNPTHYNPKGKSAKQKGNLDSKYSYLDAGIEFEGTLYKDVEEAYSKLKQNYPDRNTKGPKSTYSLMVNLITAKLQQHPQLVEEITAQGGAAWLSSSTHQPTRKNTLWETGGQNWFIESLTEAYNQVTSTTQPQVDLGTETAPAGGNVVIDSAKGRSSQPGAVVAFRTKGKTEQNMIDALADNAVGNPFGTYAQIKTNVPEAVKRFLNWVLGIEDTNIMQDYRNALLNKIPELKGKTIYYYKDLGQPSHATALDYLINKHNWNAKTNQTFNQVKGTSIRSNKENQDLKQTVEIPDVDYAKDLIEAIKENPNVTFEEAIGNSKDFDNFLKKRLEQEYLSFREELSLIANDSDLSTYLNEGLKLKSGSTNNNVAKSAELLNLKDDLEYNLRQIFFNDLLNTTAINQILLGEIPLTLLDAINEIKRAKAQNAAYDSAASVIAAPEEGIMHPTQRIDLFGFTEPQVEATFNKSNTTDNADAQLWMTLKAFRHAWFGFGKLNKAQNQLLNRIEKGEDIPYEELLGNANNTNKSYAEMKAMLNSKKFVYFDGGVFVKMSAFTLTKQFTSIKDENGNWIPKQNKIALHNLREKMEKYEEEMWKKGIGTIAMAAPVSALKMIKENIQNIDDVLSNDVTFKDNQSMILDANYLGLQTVNPSNKLKITDPTQVKNIVTSEHNDDEKVYLPGSDKPVTIGAIRQYYNKATSDRISLKYINKRNLLFNFDIDYAMDLLNESIKDNELKPDLYSYLQYATGGLEASNATSNILEMFSVDENGQQKYNLNNPQTVKKFEQLFLAFFSKGVLSEKVTGISFTLASDYGVRVYRRVFSVDENGMPDKHEIIRENVWERMRNKPDIVANIDNGAKVGDDNNLIGLAEAIEESKGKGVVIIDRLRFNMKEYDQNGEWTRQRYGEAIIPPHHTEVGNLLANTNKPIPDTVAKMFAVRIPSQDNHSTANLKIVDFMPGYYGSTGVFARELIEISGADFDIDKIYAQIKDFYVNENNEFVEYGKSKTLKDQYRDYIEAMNRDFKKSGSFLKQAYNKFKKFGTGERSIYVSEIEQVQDEGMDIKTVEALLGTGLPITYDQYVEYREKYKSEPYVEALNNDILDYKFALMGNEHVLNTPGEEIPISYQPADTKPLENLLDELVAEYKYFADLMDKGDLDVNNLKGKLKSFASNKAGANSIGAVVLPNLYLNLMQEYGIKVSDKSLNNKIKATQLELIEKQKFFSDFGVTYDYNERYRKQYVISALITAMTDNAKLRLSAKLGLNKDALAVVANMTALGVPIKTSILLINQPIMRDLYFKAINKTSPMDPGIATLVKNRIKVLKKAFKNLEFIEVDNNLLGGGIINNKEIFGVNQLKDAIKNKKFTKLDAELEYSVLKQFKIAHDIKTYNGNIGTILTLSKSLGKDMQDVNRKYQAAKDLGLFLSDEQYEKYTNDRIRNGLPAIDVRPIFENTWQGTYLKIFKELKERILPNVFLSQSDTFLNIFHRALKEINPYVLNQDMISVIGDDLLSYLTIKGYQYNIYSTEAGSKASLNNSILYPQVEGEKITDVIERLTTLSSNNYFLKTFIISEKATDEGNRSGINKITANTFNKLSDQDKVVLQSSFAELYGNLRTRKDAKNILHYIMVKDGFKLGYGSILEAITPFVYSEFLLQIDTVEEALRNKDNTELFKQTFGLTYNELIDDFIKGYFKNIRNKDLSNVISNVKTLNVGSTQSSINFDRSDIVFIENKNNKKTLKINLYPGREINQSTDKVSLRIPETLPLDSELSDKISKKRFRDVEVISNRGDYTEIELPTVFRTKRELPDRTEYKYFILSKYQTVMPEVLPNEIPTGNYAEYTEFIPEGSYDQWAGAFMFSNENQPLPTNLQIKKFIEESTKQTKPKEEISNLPNEAFRIPDYMLNANEIEANGKEIKVDGVVVDSLSIGDEYSVVDSFSIPTDDLVVVDSFSISDKEYDNMTNYPNDPEANDFYDNYSSISYPELNNFWLNNKDKMNKFKANNINSYNDLVKRFKNSPKKETEFIEEIKKCILNG